MDANVEPSSGHAEGDTIPVQPEIESTSSAGPGPGWSPWVEGDGQPVVHRAMYDGWQWHKYGEKYLKSCANPRSYYKCRDPACPARKAVEQDIDTGGLVATSYRFEHNHRQHNHKAYRLLDRRKNGSRRPDDRLSDDEDMPNKVRRKDGDEEAAGIMDLYGNSLDGFAHNEQQEEADEKPPPNSERLDKFLQALSGRDIRHQPQAVLHSTGWFFRDPRLNDLASFLNTSAPEDAPAYTPALSSPEDYAPMQQPTQHTSRGAFQDLTHDHARHLDQRANRAGATHTVPGMVGAGRKAQDQVDTAAVDRGGKENACGLGVPSKRLDALATYARGQLAEQCPSPSMRQQKQQHPLSGPLDQQTAAIYTDDHTDLSFVDCTAFLESL